MVKKIILLAAILPASVSAQTFDGFYVGAGFGTTDYSEDRYLDDNIAGAYSFDESSTTKLIAGYAFNRIISIEAQYTNYGDIDVKPQLNTISDFTMEHSSFTLAANVGYTFDNGVRPFATAGLGSISLDNKSSRLSESDTGTAYRLGLGVDYTPPQFGGITVRAAYEADVYEVEVQKNYGFFRQTKTYTPTIGTFYLAASYTF
ncbi:porin family protein [Vibrio tubiashii]|uniref:porin family protein n=1 Tax=Vibrio tubiashii TaxID=29498 RepID=UPI001EFCC4CC|nr:porin family protein [Vibrio tubiashii]MCG9578245.1 porin family protein [Vibrio tubiashii]